MASSSSGGDNKSDEGTNLGFGISLGATNSCVAVSRNNVVEVVANDCGERVTPSVVAFSDSLRPVGDSAKTHAIRDPLNVLTHVKRFLGRSYSDLTSEEKTMCPFTIVQGSDDKPEFQVQFEGKTKRFSAEEIVAMLFTYLKQHVVETYLGRTVRQVVITVPVHFNDRQRQATKDAAAIAGLDLLRIINEPTAALIAYDMHNRAQEATKCLVLDLGGSTFDLSLMLNEDEIYEVLDTFHDGDFGGDAFDDRLVCYFAEEFKRKHDVDITGDRRAMARLRRQCTRVKESLSSSVEANLVINDLHNGVDFCSTVTRARFELLCNDLFDNYLSTVKQFLHRANQSIEGVHGVVLVGGSSSMPKLQQLLSGVFGHSKLNNSIPPDHVVAIGAAQQAEILLSAPTETFGCMCFLGMSSLTLGIQQSDGSLLRIVPRNAILSIKKSRMVTTDYDNQRGMLFRVYEGELPAAKDNHLLDQFILYGIAPKPRGVPRIEVTFDMDAHENFSVSALDKETDRSASVTNASKQRLGKAEIEKMVQREERFKALRTIERTAADVTAKVYNKVASVFAGAVARLTDSGDPPSITRKPTSAQDAFFNYVSTELAAELYQFMSARDGSVFSGVCRWANRGISRHFEKMSIVALPVEAPPTRIESLPGPANTSAEIEEVD